MHAADALPLLVVETLSDGSTASLPASASVSWSGPPTMTAATTPAGGVPAGALAAFVANPVRTDEKPLTGVMFAMAAGSQNVTAAVSGIEPAGSATASITIDSALAGDSTHGKTLFNSGTGDFGCAGCHGTTGGGGAGYIGPGLNAATDSYPAGDPTWDQAKFAMAALGGVDNQGQALNSPMPVWFNHPVSGHRLSGQDIADMWFWLKTQTQ